MGIFLVERYLAGWPSTALRELTSRLAASDDVLASVGVRYLGSIVIDGDETMLCLFEGPSDREVGRANQLVGAAFDRVVAGELLTR